MPTTTRYCQAGHKFEIDGTMAVGETITVTVTPADGYTFAGWWDGNTQQTRTIYIDQCGKTFTALFNSSSPTPGPGPDPDTGPYTIRIERYPGNGGTATVNGQPNTAVIEAGETAYLAAVPAEGYRVTSWNRPDGVAVGYSDTYQFTVTGNATYKVFFEQTTTFSYKWISSNNIDDLRDENKYHTATSLTVPINTSNFKQHTSIILPSGYVMDDGTTSGNCWYRDALAVNYMKFPTTTNLVSGQVCFYCGLGSPNAAASAQDVQIRIKQQ